MLADFDQLAFATFSRAHVIALDFRDGKGYSLINREQRKRKGAGIMNNLMTHTGMVHAPGRAWKQLRGTVAPKCTASASQIARWHFIVPIDKEVTCKRCLAALAKEARS